MHCTLHRTGPAPHLSGNTFPFGKQFAGFFISTNLFLVPSAVTAQQSWYLGTNQLALSSSNKYFASVDVVNDTNDAVYISTDIEHLSLLNEERVREKTTSREIEVSPDQFVIPPKSSVALRVLSRSAPEFSRSYYVTLRDVTRLQPQSSGMSTGFILAYDLMVSVAPAREKKITAADFSASGSRTENKYHFKNASGRHIFIDAGYSCPSVATYLVDCEKILSFPKQSLLPGEALDFSYTNRIRYFGFLLYSNLNFSHGQEKFTIPVDLQN